MDDGLVIIDNKEIRVGYLCKYSDAYANVTGEVKFGEWIQDGSGGEYNGRPCYGYYVHVVDLDPFDWREETKEDAKKFYPDYLNNISLLELLRDNSIDDLEIIENKMK
jgi:hypothetical protein